MPVQAHQGPPSGLKPLTRLSWRALPAVARRLFGAVKRGSEAILDGHKQAISQLISALRAAEPAPKRFPSLFCFPTPLQTGEGDRA